MIVSLFIILGQLIWLLAMAAHAVMHGLVLLLSKLIR